MVPISWTSPRTWVASEKPTASTFNTHVRDNLDAAAGANKAACRVYNSAAITCTTGVATTLTFDSERFDTQSMHSTSVNTGRITIPTGWAGLYYFEAHIGWASNATGIRQLYMLINGTTVFAVNDVTSVTANAFAMSVSGLYRLAVADYVTVIATQTSGGNLNVTQAAAYTPEFACVWLGA